MAPSCARGGGDAKENTTERRKGAIGGHLKLCVGNERGQRGGKASTNIRQTPVATGCHTAAAIPRGTRRSKGASLHLKGKATRNSRALIGFRARLLGRESFTCYVL